MKDKTDTTQESDTADNRTLKQKILSEVKFFAGLILFMFAFLTLVWGHYRIPSESMLPTLEVGDHLYVSKFAYGYSRHSLPFGAHKLPLGDKKLFSKLPKRGDVVVFRRAEVEDFVEVHKGQRNNAYTRKEAGRVMIKRVAGLPGDKIYLTQGRLYINDVLVEREVVEQYKFREHSANFGTRPVIQVDVFEEQWPGEKESHIIYEENDLSNSDNMNPVIVPENTLFLMGDHRDNSQDSRSPYGPGFVPLNHLIGRADLMMFSFKRCKKEDGLRCPPSRFMKGL